MLRLSKEQEKEIAAYPRDLFDMLVTHNSPYAFYIFQWVDYNEDAKRYRVKMWHDIMLHDGTVIESLWPNADKFGGLHRDEDVKMIRISRKQGMTTYEDPRKENTDAKL